MTNQNFQKENQDSNILLASLVFDNINSPVKLTDSKYHYEIVRDAYISTFSEFIEMLRNKLNSSSAKVIGSYLTQRIMDEFLVISEDKALGPKEIMFRMHMSVTRSEGCELNPKQVRKYLDAIF